MSDSENKVHDGKPSQQSKDNSCSFCLAVETEREVMIAGPNKFICNRCVKIYVSEMLRDGRDPTANAAVRLALRKFQKVFSAELDRQLGPPIVKDQNQYDWILQIKAIDRMIREHMAPSFERTRARACITEAIALIMFGDRSDR